METIHKRLEKKRDLFSSLLDLKIAISNQKKLKKFTEPSELKRQAY